MQSVGRLAGGVAHDFDNMLAAILGHTEVALERVDPSLPLHTALVEIRTAARRAAELTRQLLAVARKQTVEPGELDLNETVAGMLKMLRRLLGDNIQLEWQPAANLWPTWVDPSQADQILANLCVHAMQAIADVGQIAIKTANSEIDDARCAGHPGFVPGDYVTLSVSDTGGGMDKATLAHVFEPFYATNVLGEGTGLGLATVYGIVKQNHGFIDARSEPGQGTTFTVYLPRFVGKTDRADAGKDAEPPVSGELTAKLAEDEPASV
jgi:signal transduction histidine kinase